MWVRYKAEERFRDDLLQEARIGVLKSIRSYDPERGKKMKNGRLTMACIKAQSQMNDYLFGNRSLLSGLTNLLRKRSELHSLIRRRSAKDQDVTPEALSAVTGFTVSFIERALADELGEHCLSLDDPIFSQEDSRTLSETLSVRSIPVSVEERLDLAQVMSLLKKRDAFVLRHFAEGFSLREIGEELGVSDKRVQQLKSRAVDRARAILAQMEAGNVG